MLKLKAGFHQACELVQKKITPLLFHETWLPLKITDFSQNYIMYTLTKLKNDISKKKSIQA